MKKEYVKPVMEGEVFVANEYVAACYTMTCTKRPGNSQTSSAKSCGSLDYETSIGGLSLYDSGSIGLGFYTGTMNGESGCSDINSLKKNEVGMSDDADFAKFKEWITATGAFHPVTVVRNTANAS